MQVAGRGCGGQSGTTELHTRAFDSLAPGTAQMDGLGDGTRARPGYPQPFMAGRDVVRGATVLWALLDSLQRPPACKAGALNRLR